MYVRKQKTISNEMKQVAGLENDSIAANFNYNCLHFGWLLR